MPDAAPPVRIIGLSGSLRAGSYNAQLLRAAVRIAPSGMALVSGTIRGIPLYDGDIEAAEGIPPLVAALKDEIAAADGLLLVTPEYNNSIPGVFKNAVDWLTRPASDIPRVFGGKPVGLIGASPGGFGTILSQNAWLPVLRTLGTEPYFGGRLMVSRAHKAFEEDDKFADPAMEEMLKGYLEGFAEFVRAKTGR
jgi:NAD(P)H-dependent FMN reductase